MPSKKYHSRKASENIDGKPFHRIGSFPKHMSKSWPGIAGLNLSSTNIDIDNNNSETEGNVTWLSRVLSKFWMRGHGDHHASESDTDNYPLTFPFKKLAKEKKICLFSNNLHLDDHFNKLNNLTILRLTKNIFHPQGEGIYKLPPSFQALSRTLKELDLRDNPLYEIPNVIFQLELLEILNLGNCEISNIPVGIKNLKSLRKLYLDNNQIITPEHLSLPVLDHLYLENNGVTSISGIQLLKLSMLDLSENFIESLPEQFLENCVLKRLLLRGNSLRKLPESLCGVTTMRYLDVSKNLLSKLPEDVGSLSNLKYLNISWNDLTALPESIVKLQQLKKEKFFCGENPLQKPPHEVAVKGHQSIEAYFKALNSGSSSIHNKRLKLMVLGNEKSGKTTLAKAIHLYYTPDYEEERTIGMDFFKWMAEAKEDGLQVLLVDCAGQKKYILTHQLFMSTGLLFAVVVNLKTYTDSGYEDQVGEWIDLVLARVPNAVILLVPTHIDLCEFTEIKEKCDNILEKTTTRMEQIKKENEKDMRGSRSLDDEAPHLPTHYKLSDNGDVKTYPETEVVGEEKDRLFMIPVSNKSHLEGMTHLREEIIRIAYNQKLCPNTNHILPESWVRLEELCLVEQKCRKTISVDELFEKASGFFDTRDDMIKALQYIDSIGPILYFHSIASIRDIVFLDPKWLSAAFKLIFRHDSDEAFVYKDAYEDIYDFPNEFDQDKHHLLQTAVLSLKFLRCIWLEDFQEEKYFQQVVALLKNFDLAIDVKLPSLPADQSYMLVPWFLKDKCYCPNSVKYNNFMKSSITCHVQTKGVLPDGFFQRFIVKVYSMNLFIDCFPWSCGFVGLTKDHHIKCIHERIGNHSYVTIEGHSSENDVYHAWEIIIPLLMAIKEFIKEWEGIKYKTFSICPTCYEKKTKLPQIWELDLDKLDLDKLYSTKDTISCRVEVKTVDKWLIFPPPAVMMMFLPPDTERSQQVEERLSQHLNDDEKDSISSVIGHRCEELRKALSIHVGLLEQVHSQTNWRERVIQVISLWEQNNEDTSIRMFVECINKMKPFPHDVAEICLPFSSPGSI